MTSFEEWAEKGRRLGRPQVAILQKEELAKEIMVAAIKHVADLGFTMKVTETRSPNSRIILLNPDCIRYYHRDKI